ncbi:MAG: glycosyltransferase family 8 protein [Gammaproteobacteria bacterium]|nr:glycosyltransferase family 8 protein [Gammaproteobacteria bacterium]MBT8055652.1 glycosyltransferase family 8 protein [Gammaproteobacteria bacterium]NNJ79021.1 glycosyltransferase family 8 protein [Xanthomonadales bacterium]
MRIELLSTINNHYVVPFRVVVQSLLDHVGPGISLRWHVWHRGMSDGLKNQVERHETDADLEFVWYETEDTSNELPVRGHFVPHVYTRLYAPECLPDDVTRFIYVDGDLLVLDDISTLWSTDLNGAILAAVQDLAVPHVSSPMGLKHFSALGFDASDRYFNAGVYVADVEAWRDARISAAADRYVAEYSDAINLLDQDVLNAIIKGRWKPLDYRWNLVSGPAGRDFCLTEELDTAQLERAVADPGIVHFAGLLKPWIYPALGSPWADHYNRVLRRLYPEHQLNRSVRARGISLYDRYLRNYTHGIEKSIWCARRGF